MIVIDSLCLYIVTVGYRQRHANGDLLSASVAFTTESHRKQAVFLHLRSDRLKRGSEKPMLVLLHRGDKLPSPCLSYRSLRIPTASITDLLLQAPAAVLALPCSSYFTKSGSIYLCYLKPSLYFKIPKMVVIVTI